MNRNAPTTPKQGRYIHALCKQLGTNPAEKFNRLPDTRGEASELIDQLRAELESQGKAPEAHAATREDSVNPYRHGTKRHAITACQLDGESTDACYAALSERVRDQVKPWVFTQNIDGHRVPRELSEQLTQLRHEINRTYSLNERTVFTQGNGASTPAPADATPPERKRPAAKQGTPAAEKEKFLREWRRLREFCAERQPPLDSLDSMRPVLAARDAIDAGLSADAMLSAMCLHWSEDAREAGRVPSFDVLSYGEPIDGEHRALPYALTLAKARVMIALVGPAGTGKGRLAKGLADALGLDYSRAPMTAGATPSWLGGRWTVNPDESFVGAPFTRLYSEGGVFLFDEMDAADPNMLLFVNEALANGEFENPIDGRMYARHSDFVAVAAMNTYGMGANRQYTGRERLDFATIDRWRMGRVAVDLDESLADSLMLADESEPTDG